MTLPEEGKPYGNVSFHQHLQMAAQRWPPSSPKALGLYEVAFLCLGPVWAGKDPSLFSRWDATLVIRSGQWKPRMNCSFMGLSCLAEPLLDTRRSGCWPGAVSVSRWLRMHPKVPQGPISNVWPYLKQRQSLVILACISLMSND